MMAARLRQVARDQRKVTRAATHATLREVTRIAEQGVRDSGALARNVWGQGFWRGRRVTQRSLGLSRATKARDRTGKKWARWARDYQRSARQVRALQAKTGRKAYPLIVRIGKMRWAGDTLRTGIYEAGIAAHIETARPFATGRPVHGHPVMTQAMSRKRGELGTNVREAVAAFMASVIDG